MFKIDRKIKGFMKNGKSKAKTFGIIGIFLLSYGFLSLFIIGNVAYSGLIFSLFAIIGIISIFVSIIFLVVSGILFFIHRADVDKPRNIAKKLLYERYAKGEINKEEFEQMKKDIED